MDNEFIVEHFNKILTILPCPFCHKRFEPSWDCKFVSCEHAYHLWHAMTHFSISSKCLMDGYGEEMHSNWWALLGITKSHMVMRKEQYE